MSMLWLLLQLIPGANPLLGLAPAPALAVAAAFAPPLVDFGVVSGPMAVVAEPCGEASVPSGTIALAAQGGCRPEEIARLGDESPGAMVEAASSHRRRSAVSPSRRRTSPNVALAIA
mgnify:CR=1 FL=1